jgi:sugar phosphate isomerase/epimerase
LQRYKGDCREENVRLALVTEGMIHRSLDALMDWLDERVPAVRDLEIGTGGYSPLGHSPLALSAARRRAWHARIIGRGYRIAAFNVSGNPLHPKAAIARRHDRDLRRTIALAAEVGVDRLVAM